MLQRQKINPPSRTSNRQTVRNAIENSDIEDDLSSTVVTIDWSENDAITPTAIDEILIVLSQERNAFLMVFFVSNIDAENTIVRMADYREVSDKVIVFSIPR